jgi:hypothetical protein
MNTVLSIDLDSMWIGKDTIFQSPNKKLNVEMVEFIQMLSYCNREYTIAALDHHELCLYLDSFYSAFSIENIDPHHDLFALDHKIWLNPLYIRGRNIGIGNFLFQLLREKNLKHLEWIVPKPNNIELNCRELIANIGPYYKDMVTVTDIESYTSRPKYDLVFLSLSPEWVPKKDVHVVTETLELFSIPKNEIEYLIGKAEMRWSFNDNNELINSHRYSFSYDYRK